MSINVEVCRAYVDGIWDVFHAGHVSFFERAKSKAQQLFPNKAIHLIVGVCEEGVTEYKRKTIMNLEERCTAVKAHEIVTEVIGNCPISVDSKFINDHRIDLVLHGSDFTPEKRQKYYGAALEQNKYAEVPYTEGVSTTQILTEVKTKGTMTLSKNYTKLDEVELVRRIQERTWEELRVPKPETIK